MRFAFIFSNSRPSCSVNDFSLFVHSHSILSNSFWTLDSTFNGSATLKHKKAKVCVINSYKSKGRLLIRLSSKIIESLITEEEVAGSGYNNHWRRFNKYSDDLLSSFFKLPS